MWTGLWFAERLSRPVGRLASAAERVGHGDLDVRVREEKGDDEIALLGRTFNEMTRQVKGQRDELIAANAETERRRRLFDSVLSGVTAGVIGLDGAGRIEMMNAAAAALVDLDPRRATGRGDRRGGAGVRRPAPRGSTGARAGSRRPRSSSGARTRERDLLVRIAGAARRTTATSRATSSSFDDVTDLVVAQRMAAWGDVARRIAHEVKNPLTPIQLSAERLRRKFGPMVGDGAAGARAVCRRHRAPDQRPAPHRRRVLEVRADARARAHGPRPRQAGRARRWCCRRPAHPDVRYRARPARAARCWRTSTGR